MYIQVRLLNGYNKPLFYKTSDQQNLVNRIIKVPLRNKIVPAIVIKTYNYLKVDYKVREIESIEPFPGDILYDQYINKISDIYFIDSLYLYKRIQNFINLKSLEPDIVAKQSSQRVQLTKPQQTIVDYLSPIIESPKYLPTLLHGVTGSGKTEVYVELMLKALSENKSVILMVPEVSLCMQFQHRLEQRISDAIYSFHSASKTSERKKLWRRLLDGVPTIILGVHLPILLPITNLGLIIVDEEHEVNYQEKKNPKLHSKELAILRASMYKIPILLGSATPSLNSLYNVKNRGWTFFELKERFTGKFPKVEKVLLSQGPRRSFWISTKLKTAIQETISKKEQVLIFLNRRGYSAFVMCKKCGHTFECPQCSVSLTLHKQGQEVLKCHYCAYNKSIDKHCPDCKTSRDNFLYKGIGTQQTVGILQRLFPDARIRRADLDTTTKKRDWAKTVQLCEDGGLDILVGTQSITKGYHFPKITLVGVIWADMGLHFPMYNSHEVAIQQLLQVSGRAGRASENSRVILQVINDHPIFDFMHEIDYPKFYDNEIEMRNMLNYPPSHRLLNIDIKHNSAYQVDKDALAIFNALNDSRPSSIQILGPVKPSVFKIQKSEIRHIYIKAKLFQDAHTLLRGLKLKNIKSSIAIIPS